mgnify:CR=1 FL=1
MVKRSLTDEEKLLWGYYTKDIEAKKSKFPLPDIVKPNLEFKINFPKKNQFKKNIVSSYTNHGSLENKDNNWTKKLKQSKVKPEGKIDLHGMTCVEAHAKLISYLERAQKKGKRVILIVTGKGGPKNNYSKLRHSDFEETRGVLNREVPLWLSGSRMRHMIVSFQTATQKHGGAGALYVILKRL